MADQDSEADSRAALNKLDSGNEPGAEKDYQPVSRDSSIPSTLDKSTVDAEPAKLISTSSEQTESEVPKDNPRRDSTKNDPSDETMERRASASETRRSSKSRRSVSKESDGQPSTPKREALSVSEFEFGRLLGEGAYSRVSSTDE